MEHCNVKNYLGFNSPSQIICNVDLQVIIFAPVNVIRIEKYGSIRATQLAFPRCGLSQ